MDTDAHRFSKTRPRAERWNSSVFIRVHPWLKIKPFPAATGFGRHRCGNNCRRRGFCGCSRRPSQSPRPVSARARSRRRCDGRWRTTCRPRRARLRSTRRRNQIAVHFQRQMRAAHLRERIAVARQRERTAEVQFVVELQFKFFIPRRSQNNFRRIFQHPQNHRAGGDADADVVFDDVPLP